MLGRSLAQLVSLLVSYESCQAQEFDIGWHLAILY